MILRYSILIFFILNSIYLNAKSTIPYCYQGHTTDTSTYVWCILDNNDSLNTFQILDNHHQPLSDVLTEWNTFKNYTYGHLRLNQLNPESNYSIKISDSTIFQFRTKSIPKDSITLLVGSCAMKTFGKYWILRPKINYPVYDIMSNTPNDAMIWMGDNIYLLGKESKSDKSQIKKYIRTRKVPQLVHFLQSTVQYSMWDDHDFGPNNSDGTFKHKNISLKNFQHFWANPAPVDSNEGIYYSIKYPLVEVFMTDNRYHALNGVRYFSEKQIQWLEEGLKNSSAPFKIIISGNQANNTQSKHETLYQTGEFQKIIESIKSNQVSGVLFVNGDRHHSEMFKHQINDLYPIYEFTNSSLTSIATTVRKRSQEYNNTSRIHGITKDHVFGKIKIFSNPEENDKWFIELETINKRGKILWKQTIALDEISFTKPTQSE